MSKYYYKNGESVVEVVGAQYQIDTVIGGIVSPSWMQARAVCDADNVCRTEGETGANVANLRHNVLKRLNDFKDYRDARAARRLKG